MIARGITSLADNSRKAGEEMVDHLKEIVTDIEASSEGMNLMLEVISSIETINQAVDQKTREETSSAKQQSEDFFRQGIVAVENMIQCMGKLNRRTDSIVRRVDESHHRMKKVFGEIPQA